jgi:hypothetical protein
MQDQKQHGFHGFNTTLKIREIRGIFAFSIETRAATINRQFGQPWASIRTPNHQFSIFSQKLT